MAKYRKKHTYHKRYEPIDGDITIDHPLYPVWNGMIGRCENRTTPGYINYGARGISVCDRWRFSFANFVADMGRKPTKNHSLDRINNDGNYEPDNCRWATKSEQMHNRRTFSNNTTGVPGVVPIRSGRFNARWNHEGRRYNLGSHASVEEALAYRDLFIAMFYKDPVVAMGMTERRARYDAASGVRGISTHADGGFVVRKTIDGVRKYLGLRKTFEEALALWKEHN